MARLTLEEVKERFENAGYELLEIKYKNAHQKLRYRCPVHPDKELSMNVNNLKSGKRCPYCSERKVDLEQVKKEFLERGYLLFVNEWKGSFAKMRYFCKKHPDKAMYIDYSNFKQGKGCKHCYIDSVSGENCRLWKPDKNDEDRIIDRSIPEYREWRREVYKKDRWTCVRCGYKGKRLIAHHLDGFNWCKEKRYDTNNGVTLCRPCHIDFHSQYGSGDNTKEQFEEWMNHND